VTQLFNRSVTLRVETLEITGLRIGFKVEKAHKKATNTCEVMVWGLSENTRKALAKQKRVRVQLIAGYVGTEAQLYAGELRVASSTKQGPEWITKVESGDGEHRAREARISKSFARLTFDQMLNELAGALGVGAGNAAELAANGKFQGAIKSLTKGTVLNGQAADILDRMARSSGYEWSVQDGQLQFLEVGKALQRTAVSLTPDTGLLGSPEVGEKGVVTARSWLQPSIIPGRKVHIRSRQVNGFFRVLKLLHRGDTRGSEWYTEIEGQPV
jgi:hypothetical protein